MASCREYFTRALNSDDPAGALGSICALDRGASVSALSERFGLPHHASPGSPPDRACVAAAMSAMAGGRTGTPMSGPGMDAAKRHLMAHERQLGMGEKRGDLGPVEVRSASITGVEVKQRIIDLVAVPWEQEADVFTRGEMWREVFARGAFDGIEEHAGRVRVNREHTFGDTVGKVVRFSNEQDGLHAQVKIAATARGDETLALAEEDMISASVGYRVKKPSDVQINHRTRMRRVLRAFMDHLSLVEAPAYQGAHVLAVREGSRGPESEEERPPTPALDEATADPLFEWARSRVEHPS